MKSRIERRYDVLRTECIILKNLRKELKGLLKTRERLLTHEVTTKKAKREKYYKLLNISGHITMVSEKLKQAKLAYKNANREYQIEYRETYDSFNWLRGKNNKE